MKILILLENINITWK